MHRMNGNSRTLLASLAGLLLVASAAAKLPAPSDEAKAKAAEAAAKTAHGNKLANYQLCVSMEKVAAGYYASAKQAGKEIKPATATPPCENPGPFVYTPPAPVAPAASAAAAPAPAPVAPAAPAAPAK
jgi:hypothetical protein